MPLYDYECDQCGKMTERFDHVGKRKTFVRCGCGGRMKTVITTASKPMVYMERYSPSYGFSYTGERDKQRKLKERGLVEKGYDGFYTPPANFGAIK